MVAPPVRGRAFLCIFLAFVALTSPVPANILDAVDLWAVLVVGGFASLRTSRRFSLRFARECRKSSIFFETFGPEKSCSQNCSKL